MRRSVRVAGIIVTVAAFLAAAVMLFLYCCDGNGFGGGRKFQEAEAIMDEHPDSAYNMLKRDRGSLNSRKEMALNTLLTTQALDKMLCEPTDTASMRRVAEYYEGTSDVLRRIQSFFYLGITEYNVKDFSRAVRHTAYALILAREAGDHYWTGKCYEQLGIVFHDTFRHKDELNMAKGAYESYRKTGLKDYETYGLLGIGLAYGCLGDTVNGFRMVREVEKAPMTAHDRNLRMSNDALKARLLYMSGDYKTAIAIIGKLEAEGYYDSHLHNMLGGAYVKTGQLDKARKMLEQPDSAELAPLGFLLAEARGDRVDQTKYLKDVYDEAVDKMWGFLSSDFNTEYIDMQEAYRVRMAAEKRAARIRMWVGSGIIVMVLLSAVWIAIIKLRHSRSKLQESMAKMRESMATVTEMEADIRKLREERHNDAERISMLRESVYTLVKERYKDINELAEVYDCIKNLRDVKTKIAGHIRRMIKDMASARRFEEMERMTDLYLDGVMKRFRRDFPDLKIEDYKVFLYSLLGFRGHAITIFIGEEDTAQVYSRKKRLKQRIMESDSPFRDEYLSFGF